MDLEGKSRERKGNKFNITIERKELTERKSESGLRSILSATFCEKCSSGSTPGEPAGQQRGVGQTAIVSKYVATKCLAVNTPIKYIPVSIMLVIYHI